MQGKEKKEKKQDKKVSIGGQAVIEGVLMKSEKHVAIAVRKEDGSIKIKTEHLKGKHEFWRLPFLRGIYNLYEILVLGMKAIIWSSNESLEEKEQDTGVAKNEFSSFEIFLLLLTSFGFAMALFLALPYAITFFLGFEEETAPFAFNVIDGLIKIAIFFLYLYAISYLKDIKRVFQYHGAEHMAVHCHEKKLPLTVANVKKFPTLHQRCGTAFLLIVMLVAILIFTLLPLLVQWAYPSFSTMGFWLRRATLFVLRILLIIPIASLSYELLKISAKYEKNVFSQLLVWPGLMFQKITTQKPDNQQIEVAIASLKKLLEIEQH